MASELRNARLAAGLTQAHVARTAGLTQAGVSRTESSRRETITLVELATHCAALGLRLSVKAYPDGSSVRDVAHLELLDRLRTLVCERYRWHAEAPIGRNGDLRAWDVLLDGPARIGVDAETRLHDIQALQRRTEAKARDSNVDHVVLLVSDTRHNRSVLRLYARALASTFPVDPSGTLAALRSGSDLAGNGVLKL